MTPKEKDFMRELKALLEKYDVGVDGDRILFYVDDSLMVEGEKSVITLDDLDYFRPAKSLPEPLKQETIQSTDIENTESSGEAGEAYFVTCPQCLTRVRVGDFSSARCSCPREWYVSATAYGRQVTSR